MQDKRENFYKNTW